jgi:dihydropteroate synthase
LVNAVAADPVWAWALVPLVDPISPGDPERRRDLQSRAEAPRAASFQQVRLVASHATLAEAAQRFRALGGWASEITAAWTPHDGRAQLVLAGTLAHYDRLTGDRASPLEQALRDTLANISAAPLRMVLGRYALDFASRVYIAGILNNTPDSFYDRGAFFGLDGALARAEVLVREGADLIEVGGETAQEGTPVAVGDEIERVAPLVRALVRRYPLPVAVDTHKADVARAVLDAGAVLINDISALGDPQMAEVVARGGAGLVLMHLHGRPKQHYVDVAVPSMMEWVAAFLHERTEAAVAAGVPRGRLLVDPGLNFGKHPARDLELIRRLPELRSLGYPIFVATSRKDYIRDLLHLHPDDLLEGTAAAVAFAIVQGANMLRVHDVQTMARVARMMEFFCGHQAVRTPASARGAGPRQASEE